MGIGSAHIPCPRCGDPLELRLTIESTGKVTAGTGTFTAVIRPDRHAFDLEFAEHMKGHN